MDKVKSELFYETVKWFDDFFYDLKQLFDKISAILEKEFEFNNKSFYYYKPNEQPEIPAGYFLLLGGEKTFGIQITFIFAKEEIINKNFSIEPSLIIILHNCDNYKEHWVSWNIINNKNITKINVNDGIISGVLGWETEVEFNAFQVPLDLFLKYEDEIVKEKIVSKIHGILEINPEHHP